MAHYTGRGDDGTTGLLFGGRVPKDAPGVAANGDVDEAQAAIGLARSEVERDSELDRLLIRVEHDLYVLMAELATAPDDRARLVEGKTLVTEQMVRDLERAVADLEARFELPRQFFLPGQARLPALLDVARTVVRRAERSAVPVAVAGAWVIPYLNRLSSLLWVMARWQEHGQGLLSKSEGGG